MTDFNPRFAFLTSFLAGALLACGSEAPSAAEDGSSTDESLDDGDDASGTDGGDESGGDESGGADEPIGSCDYTSPFTQAPECREYTGSAWTVDDVEAACSQLMGQTTLDAACSTDDMLGRCVLDGGTDRELRIVAYGSSADDCGAQQMGCEVFGGGTWEPEGVCSGQDPGGGGGSGNVFIQPTLECRDPLPGEPAGDGPDGQVCTWQMISASTEEGRKFEDYADCDVVYTQRPYYPVAAHDSGPDPDPRLDDATYVAELDWVRSQVEASACTCCHASWAPMGPSNWYVDAPGNWVDTFFDTGLAFSAGWIDSTAFGAYDPADNNGFDRKYGIPSTDPERMKSFFEGELAYRGLTEADFADAPPFGGPLHDQLVYEPVACENGERVDSDGTIHWTGGPARYVYVLDAGSTSPTVPPNLDLPDGTRWRIDVPADGEPIESGTVRYGEIPTGLTQRFPASGAPSDLVPGQPYYLYVTRDVILPVTRCLFTYGA